MSRSRSLAPDFYEWLQSCHRHASGIRACRQKGRYFMYSRLKILGHPIHPMLVAYPIALYSSTLVAYLIYIVGHDTFWFRVAVVVNIAAIVMAAVAALPGFL